MARLGKRATKPSFAEREAWYCVCGSIDHVFVLEVGWDELLDGKYSDLDFGEFEVVVRYQDMGLWHRIKEGIKLMFGYDPYYAEFQFTYADATDMRDALQEIISAIEARTDPDIPSPGGQRGSAHTADSTPPDSGTNARRP